MCKSAERNFQTGQQFIYLYIYFVPLWLNATMQFTEKTKQDNNIFKKQNKTETPYLSLFSHCNCESRGITPECAMLKLEHWHYFCFKPATTNLSYQLSPAPQMLRRGKGEQMNQQPEPSTNLTRLHSFTGAHQTVQRSAPDSAMQLQASPAFAEFTSLFSFSFQRCQSPAHLFMQGDKG